MISQEDFKISQTFDRSFQRKHKDLEEINMKNPDTIFQDLSLQSQKDIGILIVNKFKPLKPEIQE